MNDHYENQEQEKTKYWKPKRHRNGEEIQFVDILKGTYYFLKKANKRAIADLYELMYGVKLRSNDQNRTYFVSKVLSKDFTKWAKKAARPCGESYHYRSFIGKNKTNYEQREQRTE